ncbi:class I SAM-dependent methyltransferase [Thiolapillus sp.]|uniref:class I SAM-dependent methyltransferase n=1 Tax=Thiolapillus sp. TaxID=2017437 RepID=UPI0025EEE730|nr:class I SAM-dependent methyltransferase [Thiolapillus sp.]
MKKKNRPTLAEKADIHELYELSVQCSEAEVDFVADTYRELRAKPARLLREDFCGTANVCCEWVKRRKHNRAIGVDLDKSVLHWGKTHNLSRLKDAERKRIELINADVLRVETESPDIVSAMNFSYWLFKDRNTLKKYFERVHHSLKKDGIFFLDFYGGYDSLHEVEEDREIETDQGSFTYIWEQAEFNPISHDLTCYIHFAFEDGSRLDQAFAYHWRLWTLPEIQDLLRETGFEVTVYWQGWDEDGEPDGEFYPATEADADAGWITYITAEKTA